MTRLPPGMVGCSPITKYDRRQRVHEVTSRECASRQLGNAGRERSPSRDLWVTLAVDRICVRAPGCRRKTRPHSRCIVGTPFGVLRGEPVKCTPSPRSHMRSEIAPARTAQFSGRRDQYKLALDLEGRVALRARSTTQKPGARTSRAASWCRGVGLRLTDGRVPARTRSSTSGRRRVDSRFDVRVNASSWRITPARSCQRNVALRCEGGNRRRMSAHRASRRQPCVWACAGPAHDVAAGCRLKPR